MTDDFAERLKSVAWRRTVDGDGRDLPEALLALAAARTSEAANAAYWRLDNHVVVQGSLYASAEQVVPFVIELLIDCPAPARTACYDLLIEIAGGEGAEPEADTAADGSPADLKSACAERIRAGLEVYRRDLLHHPDPRTRAQALDLIVLVEPDPAEVDRVIRDTDEETLAHSTEVGPSERSSLE